jgi:probable F420-dependent oxidoreductase
VRLGLALPQYDYSVAGEDPLTFATVAAHARAAEAAGYDSLWVSDHVVLDLAKYGGGDRRYGVLEPLALLGALALVTERARLGTLVLCEALRPATVAAKSLATIDRLSGGRLDVGLGAGWYEPDYEMVGMAMPAPGERLARLAEALEVVTRMLAGETVVAPGRFHAAVGARALPPAIQQPRPPVFVGGKGDRLLRLAAERADGWNTCWVWTPADYAARLAVLEAACEAVGRDPATVWRSVGLYALCGEDERDLERRFERLAQRTPPGVLTGTTLAEWRHGRLVGTVAEVQEQAAQWGELGVETLVLGVGAVPFQVGDLDDVTLLAEALRSEPATLVP